MVMPRAIWEQTTGCWLLRGQSTYRTQKTKDWVSQMLTVMYLGKNWTEMSNKHLEINVHHLRKRWSKKPPAISVSVNLFFTRRCRSSGYIYIFLAKLVSNFICFIPVLRDSVHSNWKKKLNGVLTLAMISHPSSFRQQSAHCLSTYSFASCLYS